MISEDADPVYRSLNQYISFIRNNGIASWFFAISVGVLFRYLYGLTKNGIWLNRKLDFIANLIDMSSESQTIIIAAVLNFFVEFSSSLIPALICGMLLIYVLQQKAILFSIGSFASFLALDSRLWQYWNQSDLSLGFKIIAFVAPLVAGLVLIVSIWLLLKIKDHMTSASSRRGQE